MEEDSSEAKPVDPAPAPEASSSDSSKKEIVEKDSNCYWYVNKPLSLPKYLFYKNFIESLNWVFTVAKNVI